MIDIRNVTKSFDDFGALKGVSLQVEKGDVVAILGPSGSGKTTLLRCINFLEIADGGTMVFDGETFDMHSISKKDINRIRRKTAFVFQNYNLFLNKTVLQNVTEGLIIARKVNKEEAEKKAVAALEKVGMADRLDSFPSQLSGRDLANEGMTMLVVTHEMNFARNVSNKVIFMENGQVIETSDSKSFFENPKEERTKLFIQTIQSGRE